MCDDEVSQSRSARIPVTLQAVFLASNRGKEVHTPPPGKVASKVFFRRNWLFQRKPEATKPSTLRKKLAIDESSHPVPLNEPKGTLSPQEYYDSLCRTRGYSVKRYNTLETGYYNEPTPLQQASFSLNLLELMRKEKNEELELLLFCGMSPNPCNKDGDSLVHAICRSGNAKLLKTFVQNNCSLQVSDNFGRTPLHEACWASEPNFEIVETILRADINQLNMQDCSGETPLSYVKKDCWSEWLEFLQSRKNVYWPKRDIKKDGEPNPPPLTLLKPNSCPIPDPPNALTPELAELVVDGRMKPYAAKILQEHKAERNSKHKPTTEEVKSENPSSAAANPPAASSNGDSTEDGYDSDNSATSFSAATFDECVMKEILQNFSLQIPNQVKW